MKLNSGDVATYVQALEDVEGLADHIRKRVTEIIALIHSVFETPGPIHWCFENAYEHRNSACDDNIPCFDDEIVSYEATYMDEFPDLHTNEFNYRGAIPYEFLWKTDSYIRATVTRQIKKKREQQEKSAEVENRKKADIEEIRGRALSKLSEIERRVLGYE